MHHQNFNSGFFVHLAGQFLTGLIMKNVLFLLIYLNFIQLSFSQSANVDNPILDLGNDTTICLGDVILLDAGQGFDSYLWQDGSTDHTYLVTEAGVYWVHVLIGSTMFADTLEVSYWPYPDPDLGNDTILCFNSSMVVEPNVPFVAYTWQDGSNFSFHVIVEPGVYWVTVTDVHGCVGSDTIVVDFATPVNLGPDTVICECGSVLLDAGTGYLSYLWNDGSTSQFFLVDGAEFGVGTFYFDVSVVDSNNCESTDYIDVHISEHLKVNKLEKENLKLYPNPAKDFVIIDIKGFPNEGYSIEIFDSYGKRVLKDEITKAPIQNKVKLDINGLKSGFYNLQISSKTFKTQRKLIIEDR